MLALDEVTEFSPEGGWAILESGMATRELFHYQGVDSGRRTLTGIDRPDASHHPSGTYVRVVDASYLRGLALPGSLRLAGSLSRAERAIEVRGAGAERLEASGGWVLIGQVEETTEVAHYETSESSTLQDLSRPEPLTHDSGTTIQAVSTTSVSADENIAPISDSSDPAVALSKTPSNQILVVTANVDQAFETHCNNASCFDDVRERHFAKRIKALGQKALGEDLDGMRYQPDVILLQEAECQDAKDIAAYLEGRITGSDYRRPKGTCSEAAKVDGDGSDGETLTSETAIIYNYATMEKVDDGTGLRTTYYDSEKCVPKTTAERQVDEDGDGLADCDGIVRARRHYFLGLRERSSAKRVAMGTLHFVTASNLKSKATHDAKMDDWSNKVADHLDSSPYASITTKILAGDFNKRRCPDGTATETSQEPQLCTERAFWRSLGGRSYDDRIYEEHGNPAASPPNTQADLDAQYQKGDTFSTRRIDYLWVSPSKKPDVPYGSHDLTCGLDAPTGVDDNCFDKNNPDYYSDHRLVWGLVTL